MLPLQVAETPPGRPSVNEYRSLSVLPEDDLAVRKHPFQPKETMGPPQIITACHQRPPHPPKPTSVQSATAGQRSIPGINDKRGFPKKDGRFGLAPDEVLRHAKIKAFIKLLHKPPIRARAKLRDRGPSLWLEHYHRGSGRKHKPFV